MTDPVTTISFGWEAISAVFGLGGGGGLFGKILFDKYLSNKPKKEDGPAPRYVTVEECGKNQKHCDSVVELEKEFIIHRTSVTAKLGEHDTILKEINRETKQQTRHISKIDRNLAVLASRRK